MTKASYLEEYAAFIDKAQRNYDDPYFNWEAADKSFQLYSEIYFEKFQEELSTREKIVLMQYKAIYKFLRGTRSVKVTITETANDLRPFVEQVKEVLDDMLKNLQCQDKE
jgi:hypothetical protein